MTNREVIVEAFDALFRARDAAALDRYIDEGYVQHSADVADGREGLRELLDALPQDATFELHRVVEDGDLVVSHGTFRGFGPEDLVGFDIHRMRDGRAVEHWSVEQPVVAETASGHSQTDGPTEVTQPERTEESRALVDRFVQKVLVEHDFASVPEFFDDDRFVQHNPIVRDGVSGLGQAFVELGRQGRSVTYTRRHMLVAEGEFVLSVAEGTFGDRPTVFYDLFRVEDGKIAEHWDVVADKPADLPHGNGLF
ncbi:nuclear transport factor 2 family protein [Georgenia sp. AZ-5]|uniref:nuclear transport factor 2 family protein n=1 Tax=Georgenia sp. AZ-5 TaxID=3367526 RepID=UPI003754FCFF